MILKGMEYKFITIEGNIGAGKTTLAKALGEYYKARLVLEEFADNPFLPKFYKNPEQYAFPVELFFMAERYKQQKEFLIPNDLFRQPVISDYLFIKSLLFAKVNLNEDEFRLYQKFFEILFQQLPQPEILIYLHVPVRKLQQNIKKRNRPYELEIPDDYLYNIQEVYTAHIKQHTIPTIFIDATNADFINNPNHLKVISDALERQYETGSKVFFEL